MNNKAIKDALQLIIHNMGDLRLSDIVDKLDTESMSSNFKFEPKIGEPYYFIDSDGNIHVENWIKCNKDLHRVMMNNCYKTRSDAEYAIRKNECTFELNKIISKFNENWKPCWNNINSAKYYISYDYDRGVFKSWCTYFHLQDTNIIYCKSKDILDTIINTHNELLVVIFGIDKG